MTELEFRFTLFSCCEPPIHYTKVALAGTRWISRRAARTLMAVLVTRSALNRLAWPVALGPGLSRASPATASDNEPNPHVRLVP